MIYLESFPEPRPQSLFAKGSHTTVGSSGAGKALNFASLGCAASLWGLLGEDEPGDKARAFLAQHGVDLLAVTDPEGTMRHVNLMDGNGDRISIFANYPSRQFTVDLGPIRPLAHAADIVSVTIMDYCRQFIPMLRELGKPIWVDIHDYDGVNHYHDDFIEAADFLFMSSQLHPDWRSFLEARIAAGTRVGVATHGASGASGITATEGWIDVPAVPVAEVIDTNGAGDAFFAGFSTAWIHGSALRGALQAGAQQGGRAVASLDLAPVISE